MARKKRGIFYEPPYYQKYAEIVKMDTPANARKSAKQLIEKSKYKREERAPGDRRNI